MPTTFTLTTNPDTFTGVAGDDNFFDFTSATLQSFDIITGGATGSFIDVMRMTAAGTIAASQFLFVTNIEELRLSAAGNVTLADGLVAGSSNGYFVVRDSGGDDTVDGSGITNGIGIAFFNNGGTDTFKGGNGNDVFGFGAAALTSADTVVGGAGFDRLGFSSAGTVGASAFTNVSGMEALVLNAGGNNVTLTDGLVAGTSVSYFSVFDGAGDDTVDASGVTNNTPIAFFASGGADTFKGGNGNDSFSFAVADLTSADTVAGGAGSDKLDLTTAGTVLASAFTNVSGLEALVLNGGGNNVTLTNGSVAGTSVGFFTVYGGAGDDTVDASAVTATPIAFFAGGGTDAFTGGNGDDSFSFAVTDLTSADTVLGGAGSDKLVLTTAGTVLANGLNNVSGLEGLVLNAGGNTVTLTNGAVGGTSVGYFSVFDGAGNDTVDASGITNNTAIAFFGSGGTDAFTGGNGNDSFSFAVADLTSADTVAGGAGVDLLRFGSAGTVLASAFTNVSGMEALALSGAGNNVTLTNGLVGGTSVGYFVVYDGAGDDTVDASGVTNNIAIGFFGSGGTDAFTGGNGNDAFSFDVANLTSADTVAGGAGSDKLILSSSGTVLATAFTNVSGLEALALNSAGNNVTLTNGSVAGTGVGFFTVYGGAGDDTVDASLVTTTPIAFFSSGGADTFSGGGGNDAFYIPDSAFTGINGNGGLDRIVLTTPAQSFSLTANAAKITNTEIVSLSGSAAASLTLAGADIPLVNAGTSLLYVVGEADDSVTAGAGWTVLAANFVNNAVAPGHTFTEYQHSNGALLFIDTTITPTITAAPTTPVDVNNTTNSVFETAAHTGDLAGITASAFGGTGASVTYSITADSSGTGFTIGNSSGIVTVADGAQIDYETAPLQSYSITVTATNGGQTSSQTFSIAVANVNEAPAGTDNTINPLLNATLQEDGSYTFTAADFGFSDPSDTPANTLLNVKMTTVPLVGGGTLINTNTATTIAAGDFVSLSDINSGFIRFTPAANANGTAEASFTFQVQDNGGTAALGVDLDQSPNTMTLNVTPVNDAPVNSVPGLQTFAEDNTRTFNTANSNLISISDVDAGASPMKIILSSTNGTLTLSGIGGLSFTVGDGTADASMTFTGTISDINTALNGLVYTPTANYDGPAQITINTNDQGASGGPAQSDNDTIALNITAVNDAPVNSVPAGQSVNEETTLTFNAANSNLISISDADAGPGSLQVTLGVAHGTFSLSGIAGLAFTVGDGTADSAMTFTGTLTQINNALNGLSYTGALNYNNTQGAESLNITTNDQGNTGGPAQSDSDSVSINVIPVNDNPVAADFTFNGANAAIGNTSLVVDNGSGASPVDPAGPQKTITGNLSLNLLNGATDVDGPGPLVIVAAVDQATSGGGLVTITADGDFTYRPAAGFTGNDTFSYTLSDQNPGTAGTDTGLVTVNVATPKVWYVNADAASDGDGTSDNPFNTLAHFANSGVGNNVDGAGDTIFLYGASNHYTGGLTLENNEKLIGQSQGLTVNSTALEAATGANPVVDGGVVLGSGNTIDGVDLGTAAAFALSGTSVGTATFAHGLVNNTTGGGVSINGISGVLNMDFTSLSSSGGTNGIALTGTSGTFHAHGGTVSGASSGEVSLLGGTLNFTYDGSVNSPVAQAIAITSMTGGTQDFNGSITGGQIGLTNNAGATISFDGGITVNSGVVGAFTASGGGTLTITGTNSLTTSTGQILNLNGMTLGAAGVTFNTLQSTGTVAANAVNLLDVDGNTFNGGNVTVTGTGAGFDGISISGGSSSAFNFASATIGSNTNNVIGDDGIDLNGANGAVTFTTVSINGTTGAGIETTSNTNAININGGTIGNTNDPTGVGVDINAGTGNVTIVPTITKTSAGHIVDVTGRTGGTVAFSGVLTSSGGGGIDVSSNSGASTIVNFTGASSILSTGAGNAITAGSNSAGATVNFQGSGLNIDTTTGTGVSLTSNTGASVNFTGGSLAIDTVTAGGQGFVATGGGTVQVTGSSNHISTTTGTALNIANTTIGGSHVTFHDISSNGGSSGIILNNTGASGSLIVTGDGNTAVVNGTNSSGGIIQNTTSNAPGISLTSTLGPSFTNMHVLNTSGSGVTGTDVTNFTFRNGKIDDSGNNLASQTSNIAFNTQSSGTENNIDGNITIIGNLLTNAYYHGISIFNFAGTISDANIANNTLTSGTTTGGGGTSQGSGIQFVGFGSASTVSSVTKAEITGNTITNFPGGVPLALQFGNANASGPTGSYGTPGSATNVILVDSNIMTGGGSPVLPNHVILATLNGKGQGHFDISNNGTVANPLTGSVGNVIDISAGGAANLAVNVNNNRISGTGQNVNGVGGIVAGAGTFQMSDLSILSTPTLTLAITNNNISNTLSSGIRVNSSDGSPTENVTITGNTVGTPTGSAGSLYGIQVLQLSASVDSTINLNIANNAAQGGSGGGLNYPGIGLRKQGASTTVNEFNIVGLSPSPATNAEVSAYVSGQNPGSEAGDANFGSVKAYADINGSSGGWKFIASVPTPLLAAAGGVNGSSPGESHLTQADLDSVVATAIARWAAAGLSADQIATLQHVSYNVADINAGWLGSSTPGQVTIDIDAAGHGWFVDKTPFDDAEFVNALSGTHLTTSAALEPAGHMDLLTTVMHEMGEQLGLADNYDFGARDDIMFGYLTAGERRLPDANDVFHADQFAAVAGAQTAEDALPSSASAPDGTVIIPGGAGNDTFKVSAGGTILAGGTGADTFAFEPSILTTSASTPITHIADYSAAQGDTFDFSALQVADASRVRVVEDASDAFATLQVGIGGASDGGRGGPVDAHWVSVAQVDGVHAGDAVDVLLNPAHVAHLHAGLLA